MRLQLTRATDLALRALVQLAAMDGRIGGGTLTSRIGTTTGLLPQIMHPLVDQRWVDSMRGPRGGYSLLVPLEDIDLMSVIEAVEGVTDTGQCVLADQACGSSLPCALHQAWQRARSVLTEQLAAMSVATLTAGSHGGPPHAVVPSAPVVVSTPSEERTS